MPLLNFLKQRFISLSGLLLLLFLNQELSANVIINGTRFVYPEGNKNISVQLTNTSTRPALVQVWIDSGNPDSQPEESKVPFFITPPISRIESGKGQSLRVSLLPNGLPADKETVFWLNVLEIPPKPRNLGEHQNYMQMSIRSRVKIFYRPKEIQPKNPEKMISKLQWKKENDGLRVFNPTPFNFSFVGIEAITKTNNKIKLTIKNHLLTPNGNTAFAWPLKSTSTPEEVESIRFYTINDYGSSTQKTTKL